MILLLVVSTSLASEGPWTAAQGQNNIYSGLGYESFGKFCSGSCSLLPASPEAKELPTRVNKTYVNVFWRYGVSPRWDLAVDAPLAMVWTTDQLDGDAWATTLAPGTIQGRARYQFVKQGQAPISGAVRLGVRGGAFHFQSRNRLTNVGEGSTDIGAQLSIGRSSLSAIGGMIWSVDAGYWVRGYPGRPEITDHNGQSVPRNEFTVSSTWMLQPSGPLGIILASDCFYRPGGRSFADPVWNTGSQWAELNAGQIKLGGRLMLYPTAYTPNISVGFMYPIWAKNNPIDNWVIDLGVGFDFGQARP